MSRLLSTTIARSLQLVRTRFVGLCNQMHEWPISFPLLLWLFDSYCVLLRVNKNYNSFLHSVYCLNFAQWNTLCSIKYFCMHGQQMWYYPYHLLSLGLQGLISVQMLNIILVKLVVRHLLTIICLYKEAAVFIDYR